MPMKKYKSKIGLELIPLFLILTAICTRLFFQNLLIAGFLILLVLLLAIYFIFNINYIISGDALIIKAGVLYHKIIPLNNIQQIIETNGLFMPPATAYHRLEIYLIKGKKVNISPKDKVAFLLDLIHKNPAIELNLVYNEPY